MEPRAADSLDLILTTPTPSVRLANLGKMTTVKQVCVFCGSSSGRNPAYAAAAASLGDLLAVHDVTLVFGGGRIGLMGVVADAALAAGGHVVGVIPKAMEDWEVAHRQLTELHVVDSMHERKALMADLADAFIALPGGFGTLDELCEILTWAQLGMHRKPIGLLNIDGYFDLLLAFFDRSTSDRFVHPAHRRLLLEGTDPRAILQEFSRHDAQRVHKLLEGTEPER